MSIPYDFKYSEMIILNNGKVLVRGTEPGIISNVLFFMDDDNRFHSEKAYRHYVECEEIGQDKEEFKMIDYINNSVIQVTKEDYKESLLDGLDNVLKISWKPIKNSSQPHLTISEDKCQKMSYEEKITSYAVDYKYEGNVGKLIPEYDNIILGKDIPPLHVERVLSDNGNKVHYRLRSDDEVYFEFPEYDNYPNAVQILTFTNMIGIDGIDIALTSYVESTGGWVVVDYGVFGINYYGEKPVMSECVPSEDYKDYVQDILNTEARILEKNTGNYVSVRDVTYKNGWIRLLVDMGKKEGPDQIYDYYEVEIRLESDIEPYVSKDMLEFDWPYDF